LKKYFFDTGGTGDNILGDRVDYMYFSPESVWNLVFHVDSFSPSLSLVGSDMAVGLIFYFQ
jgi:hypothetical protein